jgi:hypothetical protein
MNPNRMVELLNVLVPKGGVIHDVIDKVDLFHVISNFVNQNHQG